MLVGALMLKMAGQPYYGAPFTRATMRAVFSVQVTNTTGSPTLTVTVEHRNAADTAWASAGAFAAITVDGIFSTNLSGLKELVRYKFEVASTTSTDGMFVFAATPQWLRD